MANSKTFNLPNILTFIRIAAVPVVAACLYIESILNGGQSWRWVALGVFTFAAVTDYFDGYFARLLKQTSALGKMLDPIADKLLVAVTLLMLAAGDTIRGWSLWAAVIILSREILVSGLREFLAELRVSVPVTYISKWKTALQLIALGFLIAGGAGDEVLPFNTQIGITMLWIAAIITLYTGYDYFRAGVKHLLEADEDDTP